MMPDVSTATSLQLKALASVLRQGGTLARRLSIQRAATVGTRVPTCHVIIRNTHKPQEGQDIRHIAALPIDRSQSLLMTRRVTVLAPRRWERVRLEQSLADVWTRDTLPYPGMSLTRGGSIIRASAGTLVRKLSFASIHTPFAKRSPSSTLAGSRSSHDQSLPVNHEIKELPQTEPLSHEVVVDDPDEALEEEKLSEEMVEPPSRLSFTASKKIRRRSTKRCRRVSKVGSQPMPETLPRVSPEVLPEVSSETEIVEDKLGSKKRWSNPLGLLKNLSAEGMRHMLYSSKS